MTTVVVLACILILIVLITIVLGSYRDTIKEQQNKIEQLQQKNEEWTKKYTDLLRDYRKILSKNMQQSEQTEKVLQDLKISRASPNAPN